MSWTLLVGSLAGVLGLSALAWLLGLGRAAPLSADEAIAAAIERDALDGPARAFLSTDGGAALVIGADDRLALVRRNGVQRVVRALARPVRRHEDGETIVIDAGERMFGPTRLTPAPDQREELLTLL